MAAKRKGMSLEEKRSTMLGLLHEGGGDVWVLKDLEKAGAKRGVVLQSVKDVLQSLVDDNLCHLEKIGISNYYWSFPSEHAVALESQIQQLERRLQDKDKERAALQQQLEKAQEGKEDSEERRQLQQRKAALEAAVAAQAAELSDYAGNDPERYDRLKEGCQLCCDSANRWMDNVESLRGWLKKKFDGMGDQIDGLFKEHGVKEDAEYLQLQALP